jgi:hypothetical protein
MEPYDAPGEDTEPIEYEAPRVLEQVNIEAQLSIIISG